MWLRWHLRRSNWIKALLGRGGCYIPMIYDSYKTHKSQAIALTSLVVLPHRLSLSMLKQALVLVALGLCIILSTESAAYPFDPKTDPVSTLTGVQHHDFVVQNNGTGPWVSAINKAKAAVAQLSLEEKAWLVTGTGDVTGPCSGNLRPIKKIGFKGMCFQDGPLAVRGTDLTTVFPTGITTASTFSANLTRKRGEAMGEEFRSKGANVQLGPGTNMLRAPEMGRAWEMCGADPYLCGETSYHTIAGVQSRGVQSVIKHYILNEQEFERTNLRCVPTMTFLLISL